MGNLYSAQFCRKCKTTLKIESIKNATGKHVENCSS